MNRINRLFGLATLAAVTLTSCVTIPEQLEGDFAAITPNDVSPHDLDSQVRWAGLVIDYQPQKDHSCFSVRSVPLERSTRPQFWNVSDGTFIACKPGEIDEVLVEPGNKVTLTGQIMFIDNRAGANNEQLIPVVIVDSLVAWPDRLRGLDPQEIFVYTRSSSIRW